jgi:hypothetical protein
MQVLHGVCSQKFPRCVSLPSQACEAFTLFLSSFCQTLLQQVQRDENVEALLETIRDAFEFAEDADTLRSIKPESKQAKILEDMLECVSESAKFITSYAEDVQVGTLSSPLSFVILYKHMIFRKADFKEYRRQS